MSICLALHLRGLRPATTPGWVYGPAASRSTGLNNCGEKGEQHKVNLTVGQQLALRTLGKKVAKLEIVLLEADKGKKVAKLEIVLLEADKGKRFVAMDQETYLAMAADHTAKDRVATREDVRVSQCVCCQQQPKLFSICLRWGWNRGIKNYSRCFDNAGSEAEDAPVLKILPKVHKPPTELGHPASRPVVAAATGMVLQGRGCSCRCPWTPGPPHCTSTGRPVHRRSDR